MKKLALFAVLTLSAIVIAQDEWAEVRSWSGSGTKETETFSVDAREWRIRWTIQGKGLLQVVVHDGEDKRVSSISESSGSGVSYVRSAGRHYLKVSGIGIESWTIKAEQPKK